ncbi:MAG: hypothetical protein II781_05140 [Clostridia bacterium]|nr:hypothetical protein [Clostridia bacterium]
MFDSIPRCYRRVPAQTGVIGRLSAARSMGLTPAGFSAGSVEKYHDPL